MCAVGVVQELMNSEMDMQVRESRSSGAVLVKGQESVMLGTRPVEAVLGEGGAGMAILAATFGLND